MSTPARTHPPRGRHPRVGRGWAPAHHGELLQGVFSAPGGGTEQALLTTPLRVTGARATFVPDQIRPPEVAVRVHPVSCARAGRAASLLLTHLRRSHGMPPMSGALTVRTHVPVGAGMGSSSADVLASLRAVLDCVQHEAHTPSLCRLAVSVEGACDPLGHLPRAVLFAQRTGAVVEHLGPTLPPMVLLSCRTGDGSAVDTLGCPAPRAADAPAYDRLRGAARDAVARQDAEALGAVASTSAELNQARLPRRELPVLSRAARRHGGVGVQVAHSGCVAGVLFAGRMHEVTNRVTACAAELDRHGVTVVGPRPLLTRGLR